MNNNYDEKEIDDMDLDLDYNTKEKVSQGSKYIEENLWEKVERVGKKISFAKDILALFRYMTDKKVAWYRKSIVVGALVYFISPIDAIPDLAPLFGYLDDLGVITAVLKYMGSEIIPYYND